MSASALATGRAPRLFRMTRGLDLALGGEPLQQIGEEKRAASVAVLAADHPDLRLRALVEPGTRVRRGDPLACDGRRERIVLVAPAAGVVREVEREGRRAPRAITIAVEGDLERAFAPVPSERIPELEREAVVERLLDAGAWVALRERPFERTPDPATSPRSLFVTAIESDPLAPDPELVVAARPRDFEDGVAALARLTAGPTFVCRRAGASIAAGGRATIAEFEGPHPAGLPGTHVHLLDPVGRGRSAWHVGYQDAIAIGHLVRTGRILAERVVALGGPRALRPRLVRTTLGADLNLLVRGELAPGPCRLISGSVLSGRLASGWGRHLGRFHRAACALEAPDAALHGRRSPFVPTSMFERVMPLDLLAAPLLRALLVGDDERAEELGALELAEEDLALCTYVCPGKLEYGSLLRAALERIAKDAR